MSQSTIWNVYFALTIMTAAVRTSKDSNRLFVLMKWTYNDIELNINEHVRIIL